MLPEDHHIPCGLPDLVAGIGLDEVASDQLRGQRREGTLWIDTAPRKVHRLRGDIGCEDAHWQRFPLIAQGFGDENGK